MENEMGGGIALRKCLNKEIEVFKKHSARVKIGYMMLLKNPKSAVIKNDIRRIESLATLIDRSLLRGDEHRALLMLVLLRKHIRSLSALLLVSFYQAEWEDSGLYDFMVYVQNALDIN